MSARPVSAMSASTVAASGAGSDGPDAVGTGAGAFRELLGLQRPVMIATTVEDVFWLDVSGRRLFGWNIELYMHRYGLK